MAQAGNNEYSAAHYRQRSQLHENNHNRITGASSFFTCPNVEGAAYPRHSVRLAMEKGWKRIFAPSNMNRPNIDEVPIRSSGAMYVGHLFPAFLDKTNTTDCLQVTMLRDPIDRVMSHFYYWNLQDKDWEAVGNIQQECSASPDHIRPYNQLSNNMVRHLGMQFEDDIWTNHQNRSMACQYAHVRDEHLERAKTLLQEMDLVCFVDDFEGCLQKLRQLLHLPRRNNIQVPKSNRAGSGVGKARGLSRTSEKDDNKRAYARALKNQKLRKEVAGFNSADIALYRYALEQFGSPIQKLAISS